MPSDVRICDSARAEFCGELSKVRRINKAAQKLTSSIMQEVKT